MYLLSRIPPTIFAGRASRGNLVSRCLVTIVAMPTDDVCALMGLIGRLKHNTLIDWQGRQVIRT